MPSLQIGILGIGAIGSVLALKLQPQHRIRYYHRSPKVAIQVQVINQLQSKRIQLSNIYEAIELDWLIICLKAYHYPAAQKSLQALIQTKTKVAVVRNGIKLKDPLLAYASEDQILPVMIDCPTQLNAEGYYHQLRKALLATERSALAQSFADLFRTDNIAFRRVDDFRTENWKKLIESSALGGILTLSGESCWIFEDPRLVALYRRLVEESMAVARAEGALIEDTFVEELVGKLKTYPPGKGSSMLTDRRAGRPLELMAKNGAIAALGKRHGLATELNNLITILLQYTNTKPPQGDNAI